MFHKFDHCSGLIEVLTYTYTHSKHILKLLLASLSVEKSIIKFYL